MCGNDNIYHSRSREVEHKDLNSYRGTVPINWYRYVDNMLVKIQTQKVQTFTKHLNSVDNNIKFTWKHAKDIHLPLILENTGTYIDQYLPFDSHHLWKHKLGVIRTLKNKVDFFLNGHLGLEGKKKEIQEHCFPVCI